MKSAIVVLCAALLSACASPPPAMRPLASEQLFLDSQFRAPSAPVDVGAIFAVTPAMRQYLLEQVAHNLRGKDLRQSLFDTLYRKDGLKLDYDSAMTRTAQQAFEARSGNCLSLAIMTGALAKELNLKVQYQRISVEDSWSRSGTLYFSSNHVNLVLGEQHLDNPQGYNTKQFFTVDFIPISEHERDQAEPISENTIIAMFLNNRAAEMLSQDRVDDAYWWARQALRQDNTFLNAYNTLAVIYQHHGDIAAGERLLRHGLQQSPDNKVLMFNLAQSLEEQGRLAEARPLRTRLAQLEPYPPFHFFNLGQEAMRVGDYAKARNLFQRELDRSPDYHEFHFWLAVAAYQLGDLKLADAQMRLAMENSTTRGAHDLYAAKLDRIKAYEARGQAKQ